MTCNGNYQKDRICELCELTNKNEFIACKQKLIDKNKLKKKLDKIYKKCPHRVERGYGYDTYDECRKSDCYYSECTPSIECENI